MKVRVIVFEADEVTAGDIGEVLSRAFGTALPAPDAPAPAAIPGDVRMAAAASLPAPPAVPTQLAPVSAGWRPRAPRSHPRVRQATGGSTDPRPAVAQTFMCGACGGELPEGKDRRCTCPKCGGKRWEAVPARRDVAATEAEEAEEES